MPCLSRLLPGADLLPRAASAWGPLIIFCLRIFDVSFSTMRIVLSVRNARWIVPVLAFFEVPIWITAAGNAVRPRDQNVAVTELRGRGQTGPVEVLQAVLRRRAQPEALATVDACAADALVMVEQPRIARAGWILAPDAPPLRGRAGDVRRELRAPRVPEPRIAAPV
jgi:uncharacterized protein YebE (UPF0316 family)